MASSVSIIYNRIRLFIVEDFYFQLYLYETIVRRAMIQVKVRQFGKKYAIGETAATLIKLIPLFS